ncbi:MAG: DUF58 domain-containing protein [Candidatus Schekmanbacteria bacterium]|nr:DUF58 domain-containing protein [Candidatus Schekmanbacteria bacterium]
MKQLNENEGAPADGAGLRAIDPEIFARIKAIQVRTSRLVSSQLAGDYESAFKGRGMEFEEVREYREGDDVRNIDWNVTARMSAPFVKVHKEERELTVMLVVDLSSSGAFGSVAKLKNEVAAEIAAILSYVAIRSNDRVGLIVYSEKVEHYIPPKKGRAHVWRVIREILSFKPEHQRTNLSTALEFAGKVLQRRAVMFLISDFLGADCQEQLRVTAKRHDLTAISIRDPREIELPRVGIIELEDAETGETILVDTNDREMSRQFTALGVAEERAQSTLFQTSGIGRIHIETHHSYVDPIVQFFRNR